MDKEFIDLLKEILATLKGIETALKNPAVDNDLQQILKVLGQIAQNGTTP
jgi:hypothetical protein